MYDDPDSITPATVKATNVAAVAITVASSNAGASSPFGQEYSKSLLKLLPCRVCGLKLAGSSNRRRHEKNKHPESILNTKPTPVAIDVTSEDSDSSHTAFMGSEGTRKVPQQQEDDDCIEPDHQCPPMSVRSSQLLTISQGQAQVAADKPPNQAAGESSEVVLSDSPSFKPVDDSPSTESDSLPISVESALEPQEQSASLRSAAFQSSTSAHSTESSQGLKEKTLEMEIVQVEGIQGERQSGACLANICGVPQVMSDEAFEKATESFMTWLTAPPMTPMEQILKAKRAKSDAQLKPMQNNLRFLFRELYEKGVAKIEPSTPSPAVFLDLATCKALHCHLLDRQVRGERIYQLFLLIKKVLVFLASEKSIREEKYFVPNLFPSFVFVDAICMEASSERKVANMNRYLLGKSDPSAPRKRKTTNFDDCGDQAHVQVEMASAAAQPSAAASSASAKSSNQMSAQDAASAFSSAPIVSNRQSAFPDRQATSMEESEATLSTEELQAIATGTLEAMSDLQHAFEQNPDENRLRAMADTYTATLVTAIFTLALGPRSQVLKVVGAPTRDKV
jgi:hypothetical protein